MSATPPAPIVASAVPSRCGNDGCGEVGKMKCTACQSINYCSVECQKVHWALHKPACKLAKEKNSGTSNSATASSSSALPSGKGNTSSRNTVASPAADDSKTLFQKLQSLKEKVQRSFQQGDFKGAAASGEEAILLAKKLPPSVGLGEIIQLHMNSASSYMELKNYSESESHCNNAVRYAEMAVGQNPQHPPAIELLSMAVGTKCLLMLHTDRLDAAADAATQSHNLADSIYDKKDPRLCKSLKICALVQEKQGKHSEAEKSLLRCYTILCLAPGNGVEHRDTQTYFEEMLNIVLRRGDDATAEKLALSNYKSIKEKDGGKNEIAFGDASARLGFMYTRTGKLSEAEPMIAKALEIREKVLGSGHVGVAYTLSQLASVHERLGWHGEEQEDMLKRALDIFSRGQHQQEVQNTIAQLRHIRGKRQASAPQLSTDLEVSDDEKGTEEVKAVSPVLKKKGQATSPKVEAPPVFNFAEGDGISRMNAAGGLFEQGRFSWAEGVLEEALAIFTKELGPNHPNTIAARKNLHVARQNALNQQWLQVVTEEVLAMEDGGLPDVGSLDLSSGSSSNSNSTSNGAPKKEYSEEETSNISDYEKLMLKFPPPQPKSSCTIC